MDYLQEVERRQRAALTRLLTGGRSGEEAAAEEELERIRSLLKVLISGLNKVLMNASLIAFPVNGSSPEIP